MPADVGKILGYAAMRDLVHEQRESRIPRFDTIARRIIDPDRMAAGPILDVGEYTLAKVTPSADMRTFTVVLDEAGYEEPAAEALISLISAPLGGQGGPQPTANSQ